MRAALMVALATLGGTGSLRAQHGSAYEFGFFGSYTRYDPAFGLPNRFGGGIRLGYLFGDVAQVEAEVVFPSEYTVGSSKVDPLIGSASLVVNVLHSQRNILYLSAGYSRLEFGNVTPYEFSDNGAHAAIGDRIFFSRNMALRVEARGIYTPSTQSNFGKESVTHFVGTVGLSVFAPSRSARKTPPPTPAPAPAAAPLPTPPLLMMDSDQDGVLDRDDACPNTPLGAKVDERGCSIDVDRDGVPDGIDRCPDTPSGAIVDITGCAGDADHDGVVEGIDRCPNTPAGATVDATGCSGDTDRDGVSDGLDKCPDTPPGALVDATGCSTDSDADGVRDGTDKCPNTPKGTPVDAVGCPHGPDSDGDGVSDTADKCPGTPKGVPVDETGCMILFQREAAPVVVPGVAIAARPSPRATLILKGVNFQSGKSILTPSSYTVLDQVAASLRANPDIRIEIAGYTDNTGSAAINLRLSQERAAAVRSYLARKGVPPTRSIARGYGPRNPIAANTTPAGRAQNRRVELHKLQ